MYTRKIIATLNRIANKLDNNGLYYISDKLTNEMVKISQTKFHEENKFKAEYADANEESPDTLEEASVEICVDNADVNEESADVLVEASTEIDESILKTTAANALSLLKSNESAVVL
jgi:hypothetical protein